MINATQASSSFKREGCQIVQHLPIKDDNERPRREKVKLREDTSASSSHTNASRGDHMQRKQDYLKTTHDHIVTPSYARKYHELITKSNLNPSSKTHSSTSSPSAHRPSKQPQQVLQPSQEPQPARPQKQPAPPSPPPDSNQHDGVQQHPRE